ncbi:hypothetical protein M9Y10_043392 [Tritrichomonas musculus]|uniref:Uncharacterized protein n=1 Tax=Tritrichomonas musculus TaxID=1915356 RepID=A0ABR2JZK7_9EUKA
MGNSNSSSVQSWDKENTFVFVILGEKVLDNSPNRQAKYSNYSLISDAVVIRRFALRHLDSDHIIIFAKGKEQDYDIELITKNKIFFQLSINEIYVTDAQLNDLTFCYYKNILTIRDQINEKLRNCHNPKVLLFLDDHGSPDYFGFLPFFSIYNIFLKIDLSFLYILNDSCYSGSTIQMVNNYFTICECLKESKNKISNADLNFFTYIAAKIKPQNRIDDLQNLFDILGRCKDDACQILFVLANELKRYKVKSAPNPSNQQVRNELIELRNTKLMQIIQTNFAKEKMISEKSINDILNNGIETIGDLFDVNVIITIYQRVYQRPDPELSIILKKINFLKPVYADIQNKLNCNNHSFYKIITDMLNQGIDFESRQYKRPINHCIITSTHPEGCSPTYGTRRISKNEKIIAGSPAMSAFIIETFIHSHEDGISIDRIKKIASEEDNKIKEYAIKGDDGNKEWLPICFNQFGLPESSRFFPKILAPTVETTKIPDHQQKMQSIGFKLDVRFQDDHETPVDFDEIGKDKEQLHEYSLMKYGIIFQPKEKRAKRKRYRCEKEKPSFKTYDEELFFFQNPEKEKEEYYSDDEQGEAKTEQHKKSINVNTETLNWNQKLPKKQIENFKENYQINEYSIDMQNVLYDELTKITGYKFGSNTEKVEYDYLINADILQWISCFMHPQIFHYRLKNILSDVGSYIYSSGISIDSAQKIFFQCFNVADQLVTPIYKKRETFIEDRLNSRNTKLPDIINCSYIYDIEP